MLILFLFGLKRKIIILKIIFYYYFLSLKFFMGTATKMVCE